MWNTEGCEESLTLRAGDNPTTVQSNIHTCNRFIVAFKLILELEAIAGSSIKLNTSVSCYSQCLPIGRERMVSDRVVEEMVNFWSCHGEGFVVAIGGALYYQCVECEIKMTR